MTGPAIPNTLRRLLRSILLPAFALVALLLAAAEPSNASEPVDYARQVKPLIHKHCVECHGPKAQESGLRLDTAAGMLQGGSRGPAVVPGQGAKSLLVLAVNGGDADLEMPPEGDKLGEQSIALLKTWIDQGAKAPDEVIVQAEDPRRQHWSFQPIRRPAVPDVRDAAWCRTAVDRFILAKLEQAKLRPSPEADRSTLIRRLSLDLRGLPPSPEEVQEFLADARPDAYERVVDRLLESPHYGERWARHWLDLARYADSNGFTIDSPRQIWKYRDWVIDAFNRNLPFDQFTIEQIAGDMLARPATSQLVATGFHRNTLTNEEGGTDKEQFRVESIVDRTNTTGAVFLGLTVGCAQCHDHKYDPISQREYYQLYAFLNNADEPQIRVPSPAAERELAQLSKRIKQLETEFAEHDARLAAGRAAWEESIRSLSAVEWTAWAPDEVISTGEGMFTKQQDKSVLAFSGAPGEETYFVTLPAPPAAITAIRLEALTHNDLPSKGPGYSTRGLFVLSEITAEVLPTAAKDAQPARVPFVDAWADYAQDGWPARQAIDAKPGTGWGIDRKSPSPNEDRLAVFVLAEPLRVSAAGKLRLSLAQLHNEPRHFLGKFRLAYTTAPASVVGVPKPIRDLVAKPADKRSKSEESAITAVYRAADTQLKPVVDELNRLKARQSELTNSLPTTLVMRERPAPRETHVQIRGDFLRLGAKVSPQTPSVLPPLAAAGPQPNRLDLARWLVSPAQPLTPRVTVNRFWQQLFGPGLVETENDFGLRGDPPSHPELLDYLASEFVASGWDMKALLRLIVTSSVYRQSSTGREDLTETDPRNKLLARQNRLRLDAELVRDAALAASGLLTRDVGGPSVFPPQPNDLYRFTQNRKNWKDSQGADRFRRGMYTFFWRSSPHPFLMTFDAPNGVSTCTRRTRSNTPLQALTLANDPAFIEIAQGLAARLLEPAGDTLESRMDRGFMYCFSRPATDRERQLLADYFETQLAVYRASPDLAAKFAPKARPSSIDIPTAAAWTAVSRVLLNLDEFITRD